MQGFDSRKKFRPEDWCGAQPIPGYMEQATGRVGASTAGPQPTGSRWYRACLPTYAQRTDDCVGHASANVGECIVRGYLPPAKVEIIVRRFLGDAGVDKWQIDGNGAWKMYKDDAGEPYSGGAPVDGVLHSLVRRKIMPDCHVVSVGPSLADVSSWLARVPVVMGHMIHSGWGKTDRNGAIRGRGVLPNPFAGHATCALAVDSQWHGEEDGLQWYLHFLNSWGRRQWGWHGIGALMEADHDRSCLGAATIAVDVPMQVFAEAFLVACGEAGLLIVVRDEEAG